MEDNFLFLDNLFSNHNYFAEKSSLKPRSTLMNTKKTTVNSCDKRSCLLKFVVVAEARVTLNVLDTYFKSLQPNNWNNTQHSAGRSEIEGTWDGRSNRHISWLNEYRVYSHLTTHANSWPVQRIIWGYTAGIQTIFALFRNHGCKMDSPQQTRGQVRVETVGSSRPIGVDRGQGAATNIEL